MKKRGFTLLELLSVIVVLAIIAVIAVPLIMGVIEKSREKAFAASSYGMMKAAELAFMEKTQLGQEEVDMTYWYDEGNETNDSGVPLLYKGTKPQNGLLQVKKDGTIVLWLSDGTFCAIKGQNDTDIHVSKLEDGQTCGEDAIPPSIWIEGYSSNQPITITINVGDTFVEPIATAEDFFSEDLTESILKTGTVDTNTPGTYSMTYRVTDARGNTTIVIITVVVQSIPNNDPEGYVPVMTANDRPYGFYASASSTHPSHAPYYAFNRNPGLMGWASSASDLNDGNAWLKIKMDKPIDTKKYIIIARSDGADVQSPKSWKLQGSHNETDWMDLDIKTNQPIWENGERREYEIEQTEVYLYYRLYMTENFNSAYVSVGRFNIVTDEIYEPITYDVDGYIPPMTANHMPDGFVATSSSNHTSHQSYYAFLRGSNLTGWASEVNDLNDGNAWLQIKLDKPIVLKGYYMMGRSDSAPVQSPRTWKLQGSTNGSVWVDLDTQTNQNAWSNNERRDYLLNTDTPYQYYRLYITQNFGNAYVSVGRFNVISQSVYESPDADENGYIPIMTSGNTPVPFNVNSSSAYDVNHMHYFALDHNTDTKWATVSGDLNDGSAWLSIGLNKPISIQKYYISARNDTGVDQSPKSWRIQGSNDAGNTWTTLDTRTNQNVWTSGERREFSISSTDTYLYYALVVTENFASPYVGISEFNVIERK